MLQQMCKIHQEKKMVGEIVCECVCIDGKLDMGYILFQVIQLFPCVSPARPLGHINTFCIVFPFPSKLRNIQIIALTGICSILF